MFKRNNITTYVAAGLMTVAASSALAQTAGTATVTVQNTFQVVQDSGLDFGTLRVTQPAAQVATGGGASRPGLILIATDGSAPAPTAGTAATSPGPATNTTVTSLVDGAPAAFSVTGAAPFTNLKIAVDASGTDETGATVATSIDGLNGEVLRQGGDTASPEFFTIYADQSDVRIVGGSNNDATYNSATPNLRTDANGEVGFLVGGALAYNPAATTNPAEGTYNGTFSVTVSY